MGPRDMFQRAVRPFMHKRAIRLFAPCRDSQAELCRKPTNSRFSTHRMAFEHELNAPSSLPIRPDRPVALFMFKPQRGVWGKATNEQRFSKFSKQQKKVDYVANPFYTQQEQHDEEGHCEWLFAAREVAEPSATVQ